MSMLTMQQRLGWQAATSRNSLGQLFSSLGRGHRRGRHKPHANRRWHPETMRLEDRMLLAGSPTPPGSPTPLGYTPAQIQTAYGIDSIRLDGVIGNGAGQTIAIVDYYNDPTIAHDLHAFDQYFGLPDPPSFTVVNQDGQTAPLPVNAPDTNEFALDVEWSHAIAPKVSIILVEANRPGSSTSFPSDLLTAVRTAASLPGVTVVSMSFGGLENMSELTVDNLFTTPPGHPNVTFTSGSGDSGAPGEYPPYSPNVVAVGGTTLTLNADNSYKSEMGWSGSGGGISLYESKPPYQSVVTQSATQRTIPDVAFDANGSSGLAVYDSFTNGATTPWYVGIGHGIGGTSIGAPAWAGLIAIADQLRQSVGEAPLTSFQTLQTLYSLPAAAFHDITTGNNGFSAGPGYDLVTGRGSPVANVLVPALAGAPVLASVQRVGIHYQTAIDLSLFGALAPGSALDLYNYRLLAEGPHGFYHRIRLRSARYNAATQTVVLVPKRLPLNYTYELVVRGKRPYGLKGANGIFLAGGNQTVIFSGFTPSPVA